MNAEELLFSGQHVEDREAENEVRERWKEERNAIGKMLDERHAVLTWISRNLIEYIQQKPSDKTAIDLLLRVYKEDREMLSRTEDNIDTHIGYTPKQVQDMLVNANNAYMNALREQDATSDDS